MSKFIKILIFTALAAVSPTLSQPWMENFFANGEVNFYEIQKAFYDYTDTAENAEKRGGWKQFKRWEWYWEQRVYPEGVFPVPMHLYNENVRLRQRDEKNPKDKTMAQWSFLGPVEAKGGYSGLGRVNCIITDPNNSNILWAGGASGGLWKSPDAGNNWYLVTDELPSIGVTDIAINPLNTNTMYIATGDGFAASCYSAGVMKSTNGGESWNTTGLNWNVSQTRRIYRLLMNPQNPSQLFAATSAGVYKTTNAGEDWSRVLSGNFKDMEFKPRNYETIYAATNSSGVFKTTDSGANWTELSNGFPANGYNRIALGVTPADSDYLYALVSASNSTFYGLYRSTDGGDLWTAMSDSPNILGRNSDGGDNVGQGWYDLCIEVSHANPDLIFCGGINNWRSTNGGESWQIVSMWYNYQSIPEVHADQHYLYFVPGTNTLYAGNDGGIYRTNNYGLSWQWLGNDLGITQFYRLGVSQPNEGSLIAGCQDNGTKYLYDGEWLDVSGGDGMECFIDYNDDSYVYATSQNGFLKRSTNGGNSFRSIKPVDYNGSWITPFLIHPNNAQTIFSGYKEIYKSTDRGENWQQISDFGANRNQTFMHISEKNPDYIYAYDGRTLRMTKNGGAAWNERTLPTNKYMTYLIAHPEDEEKIWASFSGFTGGEKVYSSSDAGENWTNISGSLPNVAANCLVFQKEANDRIFAGTDIGVFYIDNLNNDWQEFGSGLPNVEVPEMEIHKNSKMLYAATYGRGVWSVQLSSVPVVTFQNVPAINCVGSEIQIDFSVSSDFNSGNKFIIELSDRFGSFDNPEEIGSQFSTGSGSVTGLIPEDTEPDTRYRIRLRSTDPETITIFSEDITIYPLPNVNISGLDEVCAGSSQYYVTGSETNTSIEWTSLQNCEISGDSSGTGVNVNWLKTGTGVLRLVKENAAGCRDTNDFQVIVNPLPQKLEIAGERIVCLNSILPYEVIFEDGTECTWQIEGGEIEGDYGSEKKYIEWTEHGKGKIKLIKRFTATGCMDSAEVEININPLPEMQFSGEKDVCSDRIFSYTTGENPDYLVSWEAEGGIIQENSDSPRINVLWGRQGEGRLIMIKSNIATGCADTAEHTVKINPLPSVEISGKFNVLKDSEYEYSAPDEPGILYTWKAEGGNLLGDNGRFFIKVIWSDPENAYLTLTAENIETGCTDTIRKKINIYKFGDISIHGESKACIGNEKTYTAEENSEYSYRWEAVNAEIIGSDSENSVQVMFSEEGTSIIKLFLELTATDDIDSLIFEVKVLGIPEVEIRFTEKEVLCPDDSVVLDAGSHEGYQWSTGEITRTITIFKEGIYDVTVSNEAGCSSDAEIKVEEAEIIKPEIVKRGDTLFCKTEAVAYEWYLDGTKVEGKNNDYIVIDIGGITQWQVGIIDLNGCFVMSDIIITDIAEADFDNTGISIIPNPANDYINIKIKSAGFPSGSIKIIDIFGKTLYAGSINKHEKIDISAFSSGVYYVLIDFPGRIFFDKFLKY